MATLTAFSTLIFLVVFIGIVCWAWSGGRRHANREAAWLPFALPDEAGGEEAMGERTDVPRDAAHPYAIEQGH
ncbi:hypothetical protein K7G19_19555 [Cupriavidus sp. DB3]|uniref:cbb3-type cytochrome oxidase subunit 3 n=1 Tax=Cupriavidus sp. DB3 TaxID=2873259 RepID=UPI001CF337CB|nr:hypothetical protein [Cupriavidus sp. DB3]MCA7085789.1 hypothetical protein [Cupriavidus sp. DB3]